MKKPYGPPGSESSRLQLHASNAGNPMGPHCTVEIRFHIVENNGVLTMRVEVTTGKSRRKLGST